MPDLVAVTQADVDAGRILLRAPLSAFLTCRRIPNGSWDSGRKAWSFPATQEQARRVQSAINRLATTPRFDELVAPAALPEPAPAPAAAVPAALSAAPETDSETPRAPDAQPAHLGARAARVGRLRLRQQEGRAGELGRLLQAGVEGRPRHVLVEYYENAQSAAVWLGIPAQEELFS